MEKIKPHIWRFFNIKEIQDKQCSFVIEYRSREVKMIEGESQPRPEIGEQEPSKGREISLNIIRHGEAIYDDPDFPDGKLTEQGQSQAQEAAKQLFSSVGDNEVIVFYASPQSRAVQTAETMENTIQSLIEEREEREIRLLRRRERKGLRALDVPAEIIQRASDEGVEVEDRLRYWLEQGDQVKEITQGQVETPTEVSQRFNQVVNQFLKLSQRLPAGPKIQCVLVTHEEVPALSLSEMTGEAAGLKNCESFTIDLSGKKDEAPQLSFRNKDYKMEI